MREGGVSQSAGADNTPGKNRFSKVLFAVGSGDKCKQWDIQGTGLENIFVLEWIFKAL